MLSGVAAFWVCLMIMSGLPEGESKQENLHTADHTMTWSYCLTFINFYLCHFASPALRAVRWHSLQLVLEMYDMKLIPTDQYCLSISHITPNQTVSGHVLVLFVCVISFNFRSHHWWRHQEWHLSWGAYTISFHWREKNLPPLSSPLLTVWACPLSSHW